MKIFPKYFTNTTKQENSSSKSKQCSLTDEVDLQNTTRKTVRKRKDSPAILYKRTYISRAEKKKEETNESPTTNMVASGFDKTDKISALRRKINQEHLGLPRRSICRENLEKGALRKSICRDNSEKPTPKINLDRKRKNALALLYVTYNHCSEENNTETTHPILVSGCTGNNVKDKPTPCRKSSEWLVIATGNKNEPSVQDNHVSDIFNFYFAYFDSFFCYSQWLKSVGLV